MKNESPPHESREGDRPRGLRARLLALRVTLWTLIVPPTVWAVHFLFCYLWVSVSCAKLGQFPRFTTAFVIGTGAALAIGDNMVRISIGCEDADDLIADFAQALRQIG